MAVIQTAIKNKFNSSILREEKLPDNWIIFSSAGLSVDSAEDAEPVTERDRSSTEQGSRVSTETDTQTDATGSEEESRENTKDSGRRGEEEVSGTSGDRSSDGSEGASSQT